jgi:diguanylate cyclase (GGDEF)-like protein
MLAILYAMLGGIALCLLLLAEEGSLLPTLPALLLLVPAAALCWRFAFPVSPGAELCLDAALLIPAVLILPAPATALLAALSASLGSALRARGAEDAVGPFWKALGNAGLLVLTVLAGVAADRLLPLPREAEFVHLLPRATLVFLALEGANLMLVSASLAARGAPVRSYLRRSLLRTVPLEAASVPLAALLALVWLRLGMGPAAVLVLTLLLASAVLWRLERLRAVSRRLGGELSERVAEIDSLGAIGRKIGGRLEPAHVFDLVEREVRRLLPVDSFFLALVEPDRHETEYCRQSWGGQRLRPVVRDREAGAAGRVIREGRPLRVGSLRREGPHLGFEPEDLDPDAHSLLAVPMGTPEGFAGVLAVQSYREEAYDEHHERLLVAIAQQAAVALDSARHYRLATVDQLTGLAHREHFERRLREEELRRRRYGGLFSLVMVDLDDFKQINDRHGHLAGDRMLRAVGEAIRQNLRSADLPCRWGGEEFCVLLPETESEGARTIAERIRRAVRGLRLEHEGRTLVSTASLGVATAGATAGGPSLSGLLQRADEALYRAKAAGKDRVVVAGAAEAPGT